MSNSLNYFIVKRVTLFFLAIFKHLLELELPDLASLSESDRREFERVQKSAGEIMKPLKPTHFETKWDHKSVITETIVALASRHTKQVFNALMLLSGILEHLTNRLIRLMTIDSLDEFEEDHFNRVFDAFAEQTKERMENRNAL